mmetsp:Transcript_1897/g.3265  ORF Transcript_1897/g.3265 Transcript_1897/m.3265 type:complete len:324 (-) Transcript_1897:117-1088(-)
MPRIASGLPAKISALGVAPLFAATSKPIASSLRSCRQAIIHATFRHIPAQCIADYGDVMVNHAHISAFISAIRPHRVREKLATNRHVMAFGRRALNKRSHGAIRHGTFNKYGFDVTFDQCVHQGADPIEARLALCGNALHPQNREAVSRTKVAKCIMRSQQNTCLFRHGGQRLFRIVFQIGQFREQCVSIGDKLCLCLRLRLNQRIAHPFSHKHPKLRIHPHVWVKLIRIVIVPTQQFTWQRVSHSHHCATLLQLMHEVFHLRFQIQTMPQHKVGFGHCDNVCTGLSVSMRINPSSHKTLHLNGIASNALRGVRNHASRSHNL